MANYYCKYCGMMFHGVAQMTAYNCPRHPNGSNRGRHELYEGSEKSGYTCKFCGRIFPSIRIMTAYTCPRHPDGTNRGKHSPSL